MENRKTPNGHNHAEAYCHMQYFGQQGRSRILLTIWNSRDGVTPFITYSREYDIELQHINFQSDRYEKDHKPKKGDLIWRDLTEEEASQNAGKSFDNWTAQLEELKLMPEEEILKKYNWDVKSHLVSMLEPGKDNVIETMIKGLQPGEPHLELVKEDWK